MWMHRFIYLMVLVLSAMFFVLYPHWFAWYFLVLSLIVFPFDLLVSLPGMLTRSVSLSAPYTLEQGEAGEFVLLVRPSSATPVVKRFPVGSLRIRLTISDSDRTFRRRIKCPGKAGSNASVSVDSRHCRVVSCSLKRYWATSILGLFSIPIPSVRSAAVLILPRPIKPPESVVLPQAIVLRPKPGGGFSEEHDLRPYRDGDQMRSVHWKLSAKHDSLIVREALSPPPHSRLLRTARWKGASERDIILGRLRWVSDYLLERELPHYIKFGENIRVVEISKPGDLEDCLFNALDGRPRGARVVSASINRFTWVYDIDSK